MDRVPSSSLRWALAFGTQVSRELRRAMEAELEARGSEEALVEEE